MSRQKEFLKNTVVLGIGRFLPKLTTFITLPILTACLTKAEYGTYDLISTLIMLVIPIATLQIQSAAFRFLIDYRGNAGESKKVISNIFVVTIPITLFVSFVIQFFFADLELTTRIGIAIYFFLDTMYLTMGQITRGLGNNSAYSIASITLSVVNMACVVCAVKFAQQGLFGVVIALVTAHLIATVYLGVATRIFKYIDIGSISSRKVQELLKYSWPMVPNNLSTWVLKLSDRLIITAFLGIEANAVYSVANKIPNILSLAQSVLVMAWHENASIAVDDADASKYYTEMLDTTFSLMFGCTALLIAGTPIMFWLLIKGDYAEAYYQMPLLILAMFFFVMSSFFGGIYIAHKRTANVGITTVVAAIVNLSIDLLFVRVIGIWAGSISTLVAYFVLYIYRMLNCQKFQPLNVNYKKQILQILALIIMLVMCFMQQKVINCTNFVVGITLFCIFNREMVGKIANKVLKKNNRAL
jgi:O-antigen/teichoic acid export membrane protein